MDVILWFWFLISYKFLFFFSFFFFFVGVNFIIMVDFWSFWFWYRLDFAQSKSGFYLKVNWGLENSCLHNGFFWTSAPYYLLMYMLYFNLFCSVLGTVLFIYLFTPCLHNCVWILKLIIKYHQWPLFV